MTKECCEEHTLYGLLKNIQLAEIYAEDGAFHTTVTKLEKALEISKHIVEEKDLLLSSTKNTNKNNRG